MQKGRQHGAVDARINPRAIRSSEGTAIFPGVPGESADVKPSTSSPSKPFHGSGKVKAAVDGSEAKACLHCMQGGDLAEVIADLTGLLGNRLKREIPELNIIA